MKTRGRKLEGPASVLLVFPRGEGREPVKLEIIAVLDRSEFDKLVPETLPPVKVKRGGEKELDFNDKNYRLSTASRTELYTLWLSLKSLHSPAEVEGGDPEPVEWEIVDINDPQTWGKYEDELIQSGFSDMERRRIANAVWEVNTLSDSTMKEARDSFLVSRQEQLHLSSSRKEDPDATSSGEPVSDSE